MNAGRFRTAKRLLDRALERADGEELRGAIESSLAYIEAENGNHAAALALCDRALTRPGLTPATEGSIHSQRAMLLMFGGRSPRRWSSSTWPSRCSRTRRSSSAGPTATAATSTSSATTCAGPSPTSPWRSTCSSEADLPVEAAMDEHNLGYTRMLAGDLVGALRDMDAARSRARAAERGGPGGR